MRLLLVSAILMASLMPAMSQDRPQTFDPRKGYAYGRPARDGCVNVTGIPHNSADCSRIPPQDYSKVLNTPTTDVSGRPTGASENHQRNIRIMSGQALN